VYYNIAIMNKHESNKSDKRQFPYGRTLAGIATVGAALAIGALPDKVTEAKEITPTPVGIIVCLPEGEQTFTFPERGSGFNSAVHAITGSGDHEGDPCWGEASQAVRRALEEAGNDPNIPRAGSDIIIPERVVPQG
jgi:hypothetical protein